MGRIRDGILAASQLPQETLTLPEIGLTVVVRGLTAAQRDAFEASMLEQKGRHRETNLRNVRARLVALCVLDEDGQPAFSDADVEALGACRADLIDRLFSLAQRLSGLREADVDELGQPSA